MRTNQVIGLDNADLQQIRNKFVSTNTTRAPEIISDRTEYRGQPVVGLKFPLTIENGSLKLSRGEDRVVEQILEVLQTSVGERVYRQFFGMPNLLFESISEAILEADIEKQLQAQIPVSGVNISVKIRNTTESGVLILVTYSMSNKASKTIKYVVV